VDRVTGRSFATRSEVLAQHGMVCTSHPLATQIGVDVLKAGGSAVDAAIAVNAALGLMEPMSCGIGGDLFAIVWSAFLETFAPGGHAPAHGEIFRNPHLASTLSLVADKGRDAFYHGEITENIDAFMRANGGWLRKEDFAKHTSTWVEPVSVNYRGYDVFELPPNGQGGAALQMLNILEGIDLRKMGFQSADAFHVMVEAKKLAFEDRAKFYADPAFAKIPLKGLLSKEYAAERRKLIRMDRAGKTYDAGNPALHEGDTIYLTTADSEGNMVSFIQSNYRGFGSGIVVPGLGFGFQDRGEMFVMEPGHANVYAPGKRPFHTIIPAFIMKDGLPFMSFSVMGGAMQPQGHVQIVVNMADFGLGVQEAGDAARWQHEGSTDYDLPKMTSGGWVNLESGIPWNVVAELKRRGHDIRDDLGGYGGYQAILWNATNKVYHGASESRKDGCAMGY